ncbi:MAG: GNAT family N-acetyltransferase [Thermoplasmatales archaeon]|nr:GNAT family N-acetyltransferase [Thermoplasmatales archaeon]MCW6170495.1 GNAT family N-acetyltransferase [Thermoplasmatales archaeon]
MIRLAKDQDWIQISEVSKRSGYEDYINREGKAYLKWGEVLVYEDGSIGGFSKIEYLDDGSAWLSGLRVHPAFWRKGIGTKLTEASIERALEHSCTSVRMLINDENEASLNLSLKLGFRILESFYFLDGIPLLDRFEASEINYDGLLNNGWKFTKNKGPVPSFVKGNGERWVIYRGVSETAQILQKSSEPIGFTGSGYTCISSNVNLNTILEKHLDLEFTFAHVMEKKIK